MHANLNLDNQEFNKLQNFLVIVSITVVSVVPISQQKNL